MSARLRRSPKPRPIPRDAFDALAEMLEFKRGGVQIETPDGYVVEIRLDTLITSTPYADPDDEFGLSLRNIRAIVDLARRGGKVRR